MASGRSTPKAGGSGDTTTSDDDESYPAKSGHPDGIRALNRKQTAAATQQAACAHNGKGRGNFHMKEGTDE
jgi:hypothetical protein